MAVLLTHGVASAHDSGMGAWLGPELAARGHAVVSFDRRDARGLGGTLDFSDGLDDIASAVEATAALGFEGVVLAGHSKGTVFVPHYAVARSDPRVVAAALFGLVHDNRVAARDVLMGGRYEANVESAQRALEAGIDLPIPLATLGGPPLEMTPRAFLDFFGPDADAVPLEWVTRLRVPLYASRASTDTHTPLRFHQAVVDAATSAGVQVRSVVIIDPEPERDPADAHRFAGLEGDAAEPFSEWLDGLRSGVRMGRARRGREKT